MAQVSNLFTGEEQRNADTAHSRATGDTDFSRSASTGVSLEFVFRSELRSQVVHCVETQKLVRQAFAAD
jgi:hypothetical protein